MAARPYPAFAVSRIDLPEKTETYDILRHPEDVMRWQARVKRRLPSWKSIAQAANTPRIGSKLADYFAAPSSSGALVLGSLHHHVGGLGDRRR